MQPEQQRTIENYFYVIKKSNNQRESDSNSKYHSWASLNASLQSLNLTSSSFVPQSIPFTLEHRVEISS